MRHERDRGCDSIFECVLVAVLGVFFFFFFVHDGAGGWVCSEGCGVVWCGEV